MIVVEHCSLIIEHWHGNVMRDAKSPPSPRPIWEGHVTPTRKTIASETLRIASEPKRIQPNSAKNKLGTI